MKPYKNCFKKSTTKKPRLKIEQIHLIVNIMVKENPY